MRDRGLVFARVAAGVLARCVAIAAAIARSRSRSGLGDREPLDLSGADQRRARAREPPGRRPVRLERRAAAPSSRPGGARRLPRHLREEPRRGRRVGRAHRAVARRDRGGGQAPRRRSRHARGDHLPRERRPPRRDRRTDARVGVGAHPDHPLDRDRPARDEGRPAAEHRADEADRNARLAEAGRAAPLPQRARRSTSASTRGRDRRRGALPRDRPASASAPTSSRSSRTTWESAISRA